MQFFVYTLAALPAIRALKTSNNGRCGASFRLTCKGSKYGDCCSKYSYCGGTSDYCAKDKGCQSEFGACGGSYVVPPVQPSTLRTSARPSGPAAISTVTVTQTKTQTQIITATGKGDIQTKTETKTITATGEGVTAILTNIVTDSTTVTIPTTVTLPGEEVPITLEPSTIIETITITEAPITITEAPITITEAPITITELPVTITEPATTVTEPTTVIQSTTVATCAAPNPLVTQAVVNPSFETNEAWTFSNGGNGAFSYINGDANSGSRSLRHTATFPFDVTFSFSQTVTLVPNAVYRLNIYSKQSNPINCFGVSARLGSTVLAMTGTSQSGTYAVRTGLYYPVAGQTLALLTISAGCGQSQNNPRTYSFDDVTLTIEGYYTPLSG